ncbi:MAG TPA: hypothetical protein VGR56_08450 [Nitrososphaerales archaeon]|nr:hypothetical protein [Nitrososphaerales archaeon]
MGSSQGTFIKQSFLVSSTGSFSVSDDHGNSFSFAVPTSASGVSVSTLIGNSTTAVQETRAATGSVQMADIKLTFSVYKQSCQRAGVRLEISGTENWGPSGHGVVKINFDKKPLSQSTSRAWFGNTTDVALGFDWSDSLSLHPSFDSSTNALVWSVGTSFVIDPQTVGTSTSNGPTMMGYQGQIEQANGLWWFFYYDGTGYGFRNCSAVSSCTWSSETTITTGCTIAGPALMAFYVSGSTLYYVCVSNSGITYIFSNRAGILNAGGTITWSYNEVQVYTSGTGTSFPSIAVSSGGTIWIALIDTSAITGARQYEVDYCSTQCGSSSNWSNSIVFAPASGYANDIQILPLTASKMAIFFSDGGYPAIRTWSGTAWSAESVTYPSTTLTQAEAVAAGDTVLVAVPSNSAQQLYFLSFPYGGSWSSTTTIITAGSSPYLSPSISTDGRSEIFVAGLDWRNGVVYFVTSINLGSSWGPIQTLATGENSPSYGTSPFLFSNGMVAVGWTSGTASPYNVRFASIPFAVPNAGISPNSWSRPGLSPYESYFTHFSEYASPGNGLVTIEQGTLTLPGRGLDVNPTLVYSTPYAFIGTKTFQFDNYTLANLGLGWSLNFPWMGANYLHLSDGQAYPYNFSGNTFAYHRATDFTLVKNGDNTYTLTLAQGMVYSFDSSMRLTSQTDHTGNNTASFSYTSGKLTQITDSIGRTISFSYDGSNRLSTIASGGRSWTLAYSAANQLRTVTDPLSRVTHYWYNTSINSWLLSKIDFPTKGKVTYSYGSFAAGTEATTYILTGRTVYYNSTLISQSTSINPSVVNGAIVWSNTTISGGGPTLSYVNFNFQNAKNLEKVYNKDATGAIVTIREMDSDTKGRANATKIFSPTNALLASSVSAYDSWGNAKYTKDNIGHETWFSYANTDSANTFGSSGCSTSFYPVQSIPNIHTALVGQCAYQDGTGSAQEQSYSKFDAKGNLLETKTLHSGTWLYTDYTRDRYGNALTTTDALGRVTYFRYSSTYSSAYLTKQSILVGTQNITTTWTYDLTKGVMLSTTDPNGQTTSYQYDALDRVTLITYPAIGGVSAQKSFSYDDVKNIVTTTDENNAVTKDYFDGTNRKSRTERWNGTSLYSTVRYTYNWVDKVATKTLAVGSVYTYFYDSQGRQTKLMNPDRTNATISYDDVNNVKTMTDENGHKTVYAYDWNFRLLTVKQYNTSTNYFLTTYVYDKTGNMKSWTDAKNQQTTYTYDDLNRLTNSTFPDTKIESRGLRLHGESCVRQER